MKVQIALRPEQHARMKLKAAELGISMAEYIRRLVDRDLETPRSETDPSAIIGLFDSGGSGIAGQRIDATGAAVAEWAARKQI